MIDIEQTFHEVQNSVPNKTNLPLGRTAVSCSGTAEQGNPAVFHYFGINACVILFLMFCWFYMETINTHTRC